MLLVALEVRFLYPSVATRVPLVGAGMWPSCLNVALGKVYTRNSTA